MLFFALLHAFQVTKRCFSPNDIDCSKLLRYIHCHFMQDTIGTLPYTYLYLCSSHRARRNSIQ